MTPEELKNSILQLAIKGKLVEQRPEEGTAKDLFKKIQIEKQRLVKAGVVKNEKPPLEIIEDEKPFDIPECWMWARIGSIGSWSAGATPSRTSPQYYNGKIPWLKTGDLNDGYITEVPEFISELALKETSVRLNPVGSILMAMYGATIGKLGILNIEATTNQACCACIPYKGIFNKYLFYFLMAYRMTFIKMGEGGAQPNISKEKIVNSIIAIPPLAEQKRIVAKIEELLPYIDRYGQAWNKLEDFNKRFPTDMQKSILQMAIQGKLVEQRPDEGTSEELYHQIWAEKQRLIKAGTIKKDKPLPEIAENEIPFDIPDSWKWVRLGDLILSAKDGPHFSPDYQQNGIPFLSTRNISISGIDFASAKYISADLHRELCLRCHPRKGDILYTKGGTTGIATVVNSDVEFNVWVHVAVLSLGKIINPYYLAMALNSPHCYALSQKYTHGIGNRDLGLTRMIKITVPLPPLLEQQRIIEKLEGILPVVDKLKQKG